LNTGIVVSYPDQGMEVYVRLFCLCCPVLVAALRRWKVKKLEWNEAFHGFPLLQVGATGRALCRKCDLLRLTIPAGDCSIHSVNLAYFILKGTDIVQPTNSIEVSPFEKPSVARLLKIFPIFTKPEGSLEWRMPSSGMWRRVEPVKLTDVSEERIASIFRVENPRARNQPDGAERFLCNVGSFHKIYTASHPRIRHFS
jgi:hypothetical protein